MFMCCKITWNVRREKERNVNQQKNDVEITETLRISRLMLTNRRPYITSLIYSGHGDRSCLQCSVSLSSTVILELILCWTRSSLFFPCVVSLLCLLWDYRCRIVSSVDCVAGTGGMVDQTWVSCWEQVLVQTRVLFLCSWWFASSACVQALGKFD